MRATGSIKSLMETTVETIKGSIDANTIVGDPIQADETVVVPISKVTIGFGIGGGEYSKGYDKKKVEDEREEVERADTNFAGASAGAISVQPVAFVVVENGETRLMSMDSSANLVDNILSLTPKVLEKIQNMTKGEECNKKRKRK